jgi:lysophospholipase L1-like esterase
MRAIALAALAALIALSGPGHRAFAQPEPLVSESNMQIEWEVSNRFRLFRNAADFQRHVAAHRAGNVLAAERRLARETDGRGWAKDVVERLCVDPTGTLLETCQRDGEQENYLAPKDHAVVVRLAGAVPPAATCNWTFDDGTIPPQQVNSGCGEQVRVRLRYGKPTIAAVGVTRPDRSVESVTTEIMVRDLLITGLGDSVASGEGNPDRAIELADEGFCYRRFLGTGLSEYFRPSRAGYGGDKACGESPGGPDAASVRDWTSRSARWMSAACHRSLYSYQLRAALAIAVENRHAAVTFLPLACTGATIEQGLFKTQGASDCPAKGRCAGSVPGQIPQLREALERARKQHPGRKLDLVLLTIGANDIKFSGIVADVIVTAGVERVLFNQGGLISTVPQAQRVLDRDLPQSFGELRAALKPLVGGDLARVVYTSYGPPAMQGDASCPGGRGGLDVHPAFTADATRLQRVTDFTLAKFLPKLKALARCEGGTICKTPDSDRMTFVDSHQADFARHGFCARAEDDPEFDRDCFLENGESFDPDPVSAATAPLACSRRPNEFRPYASRARWVRTANDSYFTAMTFARALPASTQPSNIHDAAWGAMSAVYGGAFHPSAEGHAAMADAALPAVRDVLGLKAPPAVVAEPLPLLPGAPR